MSKKGTGAAFWCCEDHFDASNAASIQPDIGLAPGESPLIPKHLPEACIRRIYQLPIEEIGYVRFIVEAYEGTAIVSSLPGRGEMEWTIPASRCQEAQNLAEALSKETGLKLIE